MKPRNLCRSCTQDFTSVELFDKHRVGVHAYTYAEGVTMEPMREDGRRCLSIDEMHEHGWTQDAQGRWLDPVRASRARTAFRPSPEEASR